MTLVLHGLCPLIQVYDMPTSLRFYRDGLGFIVAQSSGAGDDVDWVLLRHGDAALMLNTAYDHGERPPVPDAARVSAHRDIGLFISCPDVDGAYSHLVSRGLAGAPPKVAPYGMKQLYVTDPDGYEICFQWPV